MKKNIIIALSVILSLGACGEVEQSGEELSQNSAQIVITKAAFKGAEMELVEMEAAIEKQMVECTGTIDAPPQNRASISNFLGGYVQENPMLVGDKVKKGQLILKLTNPDFIQLQESYLAIKAQLEYSSQAYERQKKLFGDSISSAENYQQAKSDFEVQSAKLSALKQKLELLDVNTAALTANTMKSTVMIYAPIDGIISKVNTQLGSYVSPQTVMLEIIDGTHLHLELEVYEKDIAKIKKEQRIYFSIADVGDEIMEGEVHLIGNTVDAERRTVKVHGHVPDSLVSDLRVGMFVSAAIEISRDSVWKYPVGSLNKKDGHWRALRIIEETEEEYICEEINLGDVEENALDYYSKERTSNKLIKGAYHYIGKEADNGDH